MLDVMSARGSPAPCLTLSPRAQRKSRLAEALREAGRLAAAWALVGRDFRCFAAAHSEGSGPIRNERLHRWAHALVIRRRIAHVIAAKHRAGR